MSDDAIVNDGETMLERVLDAAPAVPAQDPPPHPRVPPAAPDPPAKNKKKTTGVPIIKVQPGFMPDTIDQAERVLLQAEGTKGRDRDVFVHGGSLARVVRPADRETHTAPVCMHGAREMFGRVALFKLQPEDGSKKKPKAIDFPKDYAQAYLARGKWTFPLLKAISRVPMLLDDGRIITEPGYDPEAQVLLDIDEAVWRSVIPEAPTYDDARRALDLLLDALSEFPFETDVDRSAAVALTIGTAQRARREASPIGAMTAPCRAASKSTLAEFMATVATGRPSRSFQFTEEVTEMDKALHALFLEGVPVVHFDNVDPKLQLSGAPLCTAVTSPIYARRVLQFSRIAAPSTTGTQILASGINLTVAADLVRRVLLVNLDPGLEHPERRRYRRPDLLGWARANRPQLVAACLTITAAFIRAGRPAQHLDAWAGFEDWCADCRAPLVWLGLADPCAHRGQLDEDDPARGDLLVILGSLNEQFPSASFCSNDIARHIQFHTTSNLAIAFAQVVKEPTPHAIGNCLRTRVGTIAGSMRLVKAKKYQGFRHWRVELLGPEPSTEPAAQPEDTEAFS